MPPRHSPRSSQASGRLDAMNLRGITSLMNPQHLRRGVDAGAVENEVINVGAPAGGRRPPADPVQRFTRELHALASELEIDFSPPAGDDDGSSEKITAAPAAPAAPAPAAPAAPPGGDKPYPSTIDDLIGELELGGLPASNKRAVAGEGSLLSEEEGDSAGDGADGDDIDDDGDDIDDDGGDDGDDGDAVSGDGLSAGSGYGGGGAARFRRRRLSSASSLDSAVSAAARRGTAAAGVDAAASRRSAGRYQKVHNVPVIAASTGTLAEITKDQEHRRHISSVISGMRGETQTSFGIESERVQDVKVRKLEQIGQLRMTLEEEGIDCAAVGAPTLASPLEEIESVLGVLKLKNDRNRYSSLAEEVILGFSEMVETVFDGSREVPVVKWRPDYTGYHNTVNVKLHRMRFETSQVVGGVIERFNVGPTARILMELLPSFFLYPRQQRAQRGAPGLHTEMAGGADARGAFNAIRRAEAPDALSALSEI
jgi:hypothetical protein